MKTPKMLYLFFLFAVGISLDTNAESFRTEQNSKSTAVIMVKDLFKRIIAKKILTNAEAEYYFGEYGGILGESLHSALNHSTGVGSTVCIEKNQKSPIGILLNYKLHEILKDKQRFSFALSSNIYTVDRDNILRTGVNASSILFVRAIPFTNDKYFNDIANGVNFIFAINYRSNRKDSAYIDLVNSYINGMPFYKFLGFRGNYASGLKLLENELQKFLEVLSVSR